jgi:phosphoglycolate phosphatase-like HAD superfamily hydrolase
MAVLAVIFDFDDTLAPDSTTSLLREHGIDTDRFWREDVVSLVHDGYDPAVAWLELVLENVGSGKPLGNLKEDLLRQFGRRLDGEFYEGLPEMFGDLRHLVEKVRDVQLEFYIVSGGLKEVILGSEIVDQHFAGVYASQLGEGPSGEFERIKRVVTFTEKTRYLFEINKGLEQRETDKNPFLVNTDVPEQNRRVPLRNMIYVGDGLTDIPCFSVVQKSGGTAFGVFDPAREESAKKAFIEFLKPARVSSIHAPKYRRTDELGSLLRAAVTSRAAGISLERSQAG